MNASTAAAAAALKRSEVERELDWVVTELIATKVQLAEAANAADEEKRKLFVCKKRLQRYAEHVSELEVNAATASEKRTK